MRSMFTRVADVDDGTKRFKFAQMHRRGPVRTTYLVSHCKQDPGDRSHASAADANNMY